MRKSGNPFGLLLLLVVLSSVMLACNDDDLKNATAISAKKITLSKDRSYGVEIIYSDSAKVKAKGFAPILDQVTPSQGPKYNEMPKGIKINFFDDYLKSTGSITSDYAINKEGEKITIFRKHVVVINDQITFTTEELTWDENKRMYFSPFGTVTTKDGNVVTGTQFSAPQDFSTYNIKDAAAEGYLKDKIVP
ncbi:hypothetical protein [Pedobacter sp. ASV12]|uniref:hypothetical protein n=1 Tax=Pedobacter sp. ASV12 TaxID=2795120 RepID=UPI0018EE2971|nr:hypothetical protein [Pedobacter sp. ASV12]